MSIQTRLPNKINGMSVTLDTHVSCGHRWWYGSLRNRSGHILEHCCLFWSHSTRDEAALCLQGRATTALLAEAKRELVALHYKLDAAYAQLKEAGVAAKTAERTEHDLRARLASALIEIEALRAESQRMSHQRELDAKFWDVWGGHEVGSTQTPPVPPPPPQRALALAGVA